MEKHYNVLFLCTGNSARSIMAEGILNGKKNPHFMAYSAGSFPSGKVRPEALQQLGLAKLPTAEARSKSWDEFAKPGAPVMDFVFTVCDSAAKEVCPIWPGQPMTAHWGVADPAAVQGTPEANRARISGCVCDAGAQDQFVFEPAAGEPGYARDQKGSRSHRETMKPRLGARVAAEFLGTGFLVAAVVGSGIMAERLCRRERGARAAGEHDCDRRGAGGVDSDIRPDFGGAFQSCR